MITPRASTKLTTLALLIAVSQSSCSLMESKPPEAAPSPQVEAPPPPPPPTTRVAVEDLKQKKANTLSDIEIVWQIPRETVDGFIIRFGFDKNNLDQQVKVQVKDLEKFEDPQHGFVYKYIIGDIPLGQVVYLAIAAFTGEKISKPTDIFEVAAENFEKK